MEKGKRKTAVGLISVLLFLSLFLPVLINWLGSADDVDTDLALNTTMSGSLSGAGKKDYYKIVVNSGTKLVVKIDGPNTSGIDFDLYIKKDAKPTTTSYDARGYTSSSDEQVTVTNPSGTYYVMVYAYKGSGSYTITATVEGSNGGNGGGNGGGNNEPVELTSGVAKTGSLDATNTKAYYKITVSTGTALRVVLDGPNGADFDLYVKKGALPTISSYDARGYTNSADEQVSISNPAGTYYIMVNRYSGSGSYTITATVEGGGSEGVPELVLGQTYSDRLSATGEKKYYKTVVSAPDTLIIELRGGSGKDFDLYAKKGAKPTQTDYDRFAHSSTADETITYQNALPGTYYIMVRSYSGSGNFTLKAYLASSMPDTDGDGLWDAVEIGYGLDPYSPQYSGCAEKIPWSGYWWPYNEGGTSEAGKKYDEYVNRTHGYNPGLYQWELSKHGNPNADYWVGHCHAWSAAAILEDEPTRPVTRNGVTFYVGNLKALLTEAHFSDPVEFNIGVKNNAKQFHITLLKWIGTLRKPIVADISQTAEVWNHPLYKYSMSVTVDAQDSSIRHYVTTVTYVSDGVNPDYVGHLDFTKTYYYYLKFQNGDIVGWGWEGESAGNGSTARPDFFWRPAGQACAATCPLNYTLLKTEILGW